MTPADITAVIGALTTLVGTLASFAMFVGIRRMKAAEARKLEADARTLEAEAASAEANANEKSSEVAVSVLKALRQQIVSQSRRLEAQEDATAELLKKVDSLTLENVSLRRELAQKDTDIRIMRSDWEAERRDLQSQIDQLREQVIGLGGVPVVPRRRQTDGV